MHLATLRVMGSATPARLACLLAAAVAAVGTDAAAAPTDARVLVRPGDVVDGKTIFNFPSDKATAFNDAGDLVYLAYTEPGFAGATLFSGSIADPTAASVVTSDEDVYLGFALSRIERDSVTLTPDGTVGFMVQVRTNPSPFFENNNYIIRDGQVLLQPGSVVGPLNDFVIFGTDTWSGRMATSATGSIAYLGQQDAPTGGDRVNFVGLDRAVIARDDRPFAGFDIEVSFFGGVHHTDNGDVYFPARTDGGTNDAIFGLVGGVETRILAEGQSIPGVGTVTFVNGEGFFVNNAGSYAALVGGDGGLFSVVVDGAAVLTVGQTFDGEVITGLRYTPLLDAAGNWFTLGTILNDEGQNDVALFSAGGILLRGGDVIEDLPPISTISTENFAINPRGELVMSVTGETPEGEFVTALVQIPEPTSLAAGALLLPLLRRRRA